jgi:hypothetical protein
MARQRSQVLPFLAVIVIQLGWDFIEDKKPKTANLSSLADAEVAASLET